MLGILSFVLFCSLELSFGKELLHEKMTGSETADEEPGPGDAQQKDEDEMEIDARYKSE